jgi:nucleotide-binding universal stress UspA family protein
VTRRDGARVRAAGVGRSPRVAVARDAATPYLAGPILVLVRPSRPSSLWAVRRAQALARATRAPLHFLCVVPPVRDVSVPGARARAVNRTSERVRVWLARRAGIVEAALTVRVGREIPLAIETAHAVLASVVVGGARAGAGETLLAILEESLPVLVARRGSPTGNVVAIGEAIADEIAALSRARGLGLRATGRTTVLHVPSSARPAIGPHRLPLPLAARADLRDAAKRQLEAATRAARLRCAVIVHDEGAGDSVGEAAQDLDADLIVVPWGASRASRVVVKAVVRDTAASVLVVPTERGRPRR